MSADYKTTILPDSKALARTAAVEFLSAIEHAQREFGAAHVVLTGGTIGIKLLEEAAVLVASGESAADLKAVDYFWGDERFVAKNSDDRNEKQARDALLTAAGVPEERIHAMGSTDEFANVDDAAAAYAELLSSFGSDEFPLPRFDVLLLGMGPDGHTASLFPGTGLINEEGLTVPVRNSPKPPPERVSLTRSTINSARRVWMVVGGEEKAPQVAAAFAGEPADVVPAGAVAGVEETRWFLDEAAYSQVAARTKGQTA